MDEYGSCTASSSGASFFAWQRRARNEWLVMNRKGKCEGYRRQAKRRLARCLLPAFLCTHIFIKRETSWYEAGSCSSYNVRIFENFPFHSSKLKRYISVFKRLPLRTSSKTPRFQKDLFSKASIIACFSLGAKQKRVTTHAFSSKNALV